MPVPNIIFFLLFTVCTKEIFRIYSNLKAIVCSSHLTNNKFPFFSALVSLAFIFANTFLSFPCCQSNNLVPITINGIPLKSLLSSLQRILWYWTQISKTRQTPIAKAFHVKALSSVHFFFHFLSFRFFRNETKWKLCTTKWKPRADIEAKINHDDRGLTCACAAVVCYIKRCTKAT